MLTKTPLQSSGAELLRLNSAPELWSGVHRFTFDRRSSVGAVQTNPRLITPLGSVVDDGASRPPRAPRRRGGATGACDGPCDGAYGAHAAGTPQRHAGPPDRGRRLSPRHGGFRSRGSHRVSATLPREEEVEPGRLEDEPCASTDARVPLRPLRLAATVRLTTRANWRRRITGSQRARRS